MTFALLGLRSDKRGRYRRLNTLRYRHKGHFSLFAKRRSQKFKKNLINFFSHVLNGLAGFGYPKNFQRGSF